MSRSAPVTTVNGYGLFIGYDENIFIILLEQLFLAGVFFKRIAVFELAQRLFGFLQLDVDLGLIGAQFGQFAVLAQQRENINVVQEQVVHQENGECQDVLVPKRLQILFHTVKGKGFGAKPERRMKKICAAGC